MALAEAHGLMPTAEEIRVIERKAMEPQPFRLRRTFWNYPALAAFQSRRLTQLVYLSRFSDAIHRTMYLVRPRAVGLEPLTEIAAE